MKNVDLLVTINLEDYNFALKHFKVKTKFIEGIGFQSTRFNSCIPYKSKLVLKRELGIDKDDYVITYVAELSNRKRQLYLLKTIKDMDLSKIKIILVGNNLIKNKIKKAIDKYKLQNKVKILGFRNDVSSLLDISDLVISVSKQEGLPLNIMEAMKKEKPIIVTNCRGNRDLITNGINGITIPLKDKKALIDAITYMRENPKDAIKMGCANRELVSRYSIEEILPQYTEVYKELLGVQHEKHI